MSIVGTFEINLYIGFRLPSEKSVKTLLPKLLSRLETRTGLLKVPRLSTLLPIATSRARWRWPLAKSELVSRERAYSKAWAPFIVWTPFWAIRGLFLFSQAIVGSYSASG